MVASSGKANVQAIRISVETPLSKADSRYYEVQNHTLVLTALHRVDGRDLDVIPLQLTKDLAIRHDLRFERGDDCDIFLLV